MKGLMLKDYYNNLRNMRYFLFMLILFSAFGYILENPGYFNMMQVIMCINLGFSVFSYDEYNKWDVFALVLPVDRKVIVKSRYLEGIVLTATVAVCCTVLGMITSILLKADLWESLAAGISCFALTLFFYSMIFPFIYKIGPESARIILVVVLLGVGAICFILIQFADRIEQMAVFIWPISSVYLVFMPVLALVLGAYYLSYRISVRIYEQKEF